MIQMASVQKCQCQAYCCCCVILCAFCKYVETYFSVFLVHATMMASVRCVIVYGREFYEHLAFVYYCESI